MVKLGDVVDISFGIKTGCNEFFYIDEDDLKKWKIEKEFLVPAIKSPSEFKQFQISQENISLKLFLCQSSKTILNNSKALDYIQWGESKGFDRRSSVKSRKNWYNIGDKTAPEFAISTTINRFARIYEINDPIYVSDNFGEIRMKPKFSQYAKELGTIFQSTLFNFMVELGGRNPYGGGAMKIQMYEMNQLKIPNPKLIKKTPRINRELFSNISEELNSSDRAVVDDAVYESIQITNNERKTIQLYYEQILTNRVVKSNSVSGS